jgi:hypothetical protein
MMINIKKVVILGRSEKFTDIVSSLFDTAEISTIPWRCCINNADLTKDYLPDLIVVCGYDYASSYYEFKRYLDINVSRPYQVICSLSKPSTRIIYIDTEHGCNTLTFSRYQFAKGMLAQKILIGFDNTCILSIPTVLNYQGRANIQGGRLTELIFNFFIGIGLLRTISLDELKRVFLDALESKSQLNFSVLTPRFLEFRRTLFIDRMLRFLSG